MFYWVLITPLILIKRLSLWRRIDDVWSSLGSMQPFTCVLWKICSEKFTLKHHSSLQFHWKRLRQSCFPFFLPERFPCRTDPEECFCMQSIFQFSRNLSEIAGQLFNSLTLIWVGFLGDRFGVGGVKLPPLSKTG